jgi:preprotein translocase subunit SecG
MLLAEALIESVSSTGMQWFIHWFFEIMISVLAIFLILLVLVQRGRGGGIAGALGGMGGNSAFGTKAGDTFTWITYGTAAIWILLAMLTIKTFTDPHLDKQRLADQKEREEEEPLSPLDIGNPTGETGEKATGEDGKLRDEGAFFDEKSSPTGAAKAPDDGAPAAADEKAAPTPSDDAGAKDDAKLKTETPEPENASSDEPK